MHWNLNCIQSTSFRFYKVIFYAFIMSLMRATCPAYLINVIWSISLIFGEQWNLWSSSLFYLLCFPVYVIVLTCYKINWTHTTVFLVLFVYFCVKYLVFQAAPPLPPSPEEALRLQAESGRESFFLGVKKLLKNRGFILVLITYGLAVSVINSLGTLLNELILPYFPVCMCVIRNLYYWCLNWITASKTWAKDTRNTLCFRHY